MRATAAAPPSGTRGPVFPSLLAALALAGLTGMAPQPPEVEPGEPGEPVLENAAPPTRPLTELQPDPEARATPPAPPSDDLRDEPWPGYRLRDRIVAVVDEDPILQSSVEQVISLGLVEPRPGESEAAFRRRVVDALIDQRLRYHEVARFGVGRVPVEAIEAQIEEIRERFPSETAFQERLAAIGLDEDLLGQLVARQLSVLRYVDERLGPRVFVSVDDIQSYYRSVLGPTLEARGQSVPPVQEVREEIRALLKEQRLNEEIERWTEELRREADVLHLADDYPEELPPVVERFDEEPDGG